MAFRTDGDIDAKSEWDVKKKSFSFQYLHSMCVCVCNNISFREGFVASRVSPMMIERDSNFMYALPGEKEK